LIHLSQPAESKIRSKSQKTKRKKKKKNLFQIPQDGSRSPKTKDEISGLGLFGDLEESPGGDRRKGHPQQTIILEEAAEEVLRF